MSPESARASASITIRDLRHLADIAKADREAFIKRYPRYKRSASSVLLVALCQGAALHYVDHITGVNDFDVWTFYKDIPGTPPYPPRRHSHARFGKASDPTPPRYSSFYGRRIDLLGRSIPSKGGAIESVRSYLREGQTKTARELAKKAVVVLEPVRDQGRVIWLRGQPSEAGK